MFRGVFPSDSSAAPLQLRSVGWENIQEHTRDGGWRRRERERNDAMTEILAPALSMSFFTKDTLCQLS